MQINTRPLQFLSHKGDFWFRLFGYGLSINNYPPLFSQRLGFTTSPAIKLPFGYKATALRP